MYGLKILGKIELPEKKISPEEYRPFLEEKLTARSREINEHWGLDFLDNEGAIKIPEVEETVKDRQFVSDREEEWAIYKHQTVAEWRATRAKNPSLIAEMAVTLSLSRQLGDRFIVARASSYDDYRYGVDNLLIDRESGAAVCGFDDVLGFTGDDGGSKKQKKMEKSLAAGGSRVKYGATVSAGRLLRQPLEHLPTFYLSLSKQELDDLLKDLKAGETVTEKERALGNKLINSLAAQREAAKNIATNPELQENLNLFNESLLAMESLINKTEPEPELAAPEV
jgi:hypothetical protein